MPVYIGITHADAGSDPKSANTCAANQAITHHSLPRVDRREIAKGGRPRRRGGTRSARCTRRTELDREGRSFDGALEVVESADISRVSTRWAMRVLRGAGIPKCKRGVADIERGLPFEGPHIEVTHLLPIPELSGSWRLTKRGSEVAIGAE